MLSTPTHLNFYVMELFKSKQQKKIEALDLPFACKVVEIKPLKKDWSLAITEKNTVILLKGDRVASQFNKIIYWILFVFLILIGASKIILTRIKAEKINKILICYIKV